MDFDKKEKKTDHLNFVFQPSVAKKLRKIAQEEELSMGAVLEQLIERAWTDGMDGTEA